MATATIAKRPDSFFLNLDVSFVVKSVTRYKVDVMQSIVVPIESVEIE